MAVFKGGERPGVNDGTELLSPFNREQMGVYESISQTILRGAMAPFISRHGSAVLDPFFYEMLNLPTRLLGDFLATKHPLRGKSLGKLDPNKIWGLLNKLPVSAQKLQPYKTVSGGELQVPTSYYDDGQDNWVSMPSPQNPLDTLFGPDIDSDLFRYYSAEIKDKRPDIFSKRAQYLSGELNNSFNLGLDGSPEQLKNYFLMLGAEANIIQVNFSGDEVAANMGQDEDAFQHAVGD